MIDPNDVYIEIDGVRVECWVDDAAKSAAPKLRKLTEINAKRQGRHDRIVLKLTLDDNPYKISSVNWAWWRAAWRKADNEVKWMGI
jgi:hypothetical protein